jgi:flagellar basal body-associated protein FliL
VAEEKTIAPAKRFGGVLIAVIVTLIVVVLATVFFWNRHKSTSAVPQVHETVQGKNEDAPIYPVPPAQVPSDTTKHDSSTTH